MSLKEIDFPKSLRYSYNSKNKPFEFYSKAFSNSNDVCFLLGYFSTNAIQVLIPSFCEFLNKKGKLYFIINQFVSKRDFNNLFNLDDKIENENELVSIFEDMKELRDRMSKSNKFFFNCLRFLYKEGRLNFVVIKPKTKNISHFKEVLFFDGDNHVYANGSSNFTSNGLLGNAESIKIERSWATEPEKAAIDEFQKEFKEIYTKSNSEFEYLSKNEFEIIDHASKERVLKDLIEDGLEVLDEYARNKPEFKENLLKIEEEFRKKIEEIENEPSFPFDQPRSYQIEAYENWVKNDYKGIFAMATGTGKTITSLNCILQEYYKSEKYKFLVLVPTRALVEQWEKEILIKFNFSNLISVRSKYFYEDLKYDDKDDNSCILVTYATFKSQKFQKEFNRLRHKDNFTLIADEAHNMGSNGFLEVMNSLKALNKRIGLSATPSRYFDEAGEREVYDFFNTEIIDNIPQFSYSFSISEAINAKPERFLCPYKYEIRFVELMAGELEQYRKYTRQLLNYLDKDGKLKKIPEVENILKLRKDIIKKAKNKKKKLVDIINEIGVDKFKYAFVYVPEGKEIDYSESDLDWNEDDNIEDSKIIADYTKKINEIYDFKIPIRHFTGKTNDRELILNQFASGKYAALFAMKCLDEGVDVPRTEIAIFCSSTGNPRQYVQRRGRVLRLHDDKDEALIYDMIVIPILEDLNDNSKEYNCERNLVMGEIRRLVEFAKDSKSIDDVLLNKDLIKVCDFFKINIQEFLN